MALRSSVFTTSSCICIDEINTQLLTEMVETTINGRSLLALILFKHWHSEEGCPKSSNTKGPEQRIITNKAKVHWEISSRQVGRG